MIISHKHKFIFIRTRKTASTSMELALRNFCGEHDVITPIHVIESVSPKDYKGRPMQNYKEYEFSLHEPAMSIRNKIGAKVFDSYYKFCFERNSYKKSVSAYLFWLKRLIRNHRLPDSKQSYITMFNEQPVPTTLNDHVELYTKFMVEEPIFRFEDWWIYHSFCDQLLVDDIFQFDGSMSDAFDIMAEKLNLPREGFIEYKEKTQYSVGFDKSWLIKNNTIRDLIEASYFREIDKFGYTP